PRTRSYPLWAVLGSREFMTAVRERLNLDLPLANTFWLLREFFSLICAVLGDEMPRARVYHAHTTGYAALLGAAAARAHGKKFLLTEHNLYVRDTINTLLERNMALPVTDGGVGHRLPTALVRQRGPGTRRHTVGRCAG